MRIPKKGSSEKWHVCHHFLKNNYSSGDFFFGGKVFKKNIFGWLFWRTLSSKKNSTTKKGLIVGICQFFSPKVTRKHPALPKKTQLHPLQTLRFFLGPLEAGETPWQLAESEGLHRRWKGEGWRVVRNQRFFNLLETNSQDFHLQNGELEDISKLGLNGQFSDGNFNFLSPFFFGGANF